MAKIAAELFIYGSLLELQLQDEELRPRTQVMVNGDGEPCVRRSWGRT